MVKSYRVIYYFKIIASFIVIYTLHICNGIQHFECATLRESAFRKLSKVAKQNWCCNKICKIQEPGLKIQATKSTISIFFTDNIHWYSKRTKQNYQ